MNFAIRGMLAALLVLSAFAQEPSAKGVNFYSLDREIRTGQQVAGDLERSLPIIRVPRLDAYIAKLGALLANYADRQFAYRFTVYEDRGFPSVAPAELLMPKDPFLGQPVEPVAVSGGPIFVPISLLANAQNEAEFAFQLAHAMAHIALRHATKAATRKELVDLAMVALENEGVTRVKAARDGIVAPAAMEFGLLTFIRASELQADKAATEMVAAAGYDPEEAIRYLEGKAALGGGGLDKLMSAHPTPESRVAAVKARNQQLPMHAYTTGTGEFAEMKALAGNIH